MNSSSSGTANSDASYVTRTGSETSKKRDTDEECEFGVVVVFFYRCRYNN